MVAVWPVIMFVVLGVCGGVGGCWTDGVDEVLKVPTPATDSATILTCPSAPAERQEPIGDPARTFEYNPETRFT